MSTTSMTIWLQLAIQYDYNWQDNMITTSKSTI